MNFLGAICVALLAACYVQAQENETCRRISGNGLSLNPACRERRTEYKVEKEMKDGKRLMCACPVPLIQTCYYCQVQNPSTTTSEPGTTEQSSSTASEASTTEVAGTTEEVVSTTSEVGSSSPASEEPATSENPVDETSPAEEASTSTALPETTVATD